MGYIALDAIILPASMRHKAGGTAANVAANLTYLGWSSEVLARLGSDAPARRIAYDLRDAGVDVSGLLRDKSTETPVVIHSVNPPSHSFHFRCPQCERKLPIHRPVTDAQVDGRYLAGAGQSQPTVFFFDRASSPALELAARLREAGSLIVFEPSSRGSQQRSSRAGALADVLKWSSEMRPALHARSLRPRTNQLQIETRGSKGLRFRIGSAPWASLPALDVDVVDTAGAGDWLTAAFVDALSARAPASLTSPELAELLRRAQAIATLSCRYAGARAISALPRAAVARATQQLLEEQELTRLPRPPRERRSRAVDVCSTCLGKKQSHR